MDLNHYKTIVTATIGIKWAASLLVLLLFFGSAIAEDKWQKSKLIGGWETKVLPKDRAKLLLYRTKRVNAVRHLNQYPEPYTPSDAVFGQVEDGKGWQNINHFFISNPQLLLFTTIPNSLTSFDYNAPKDNSSREQTIKHIANLTFVKYSGRSANNWMRWAKDHNGIRLWGVNARDAGFNYAMLDLSKSKNINTSSSGDMVRNPVPMKSFYHYGANVGGNNLSPSYPAMQVRFEDYQKPTKLVIKLWREKPSTGDEKADYFQVIVVNPTSN